MKVQLFIPCFVNQFYPQVGKNMLKLLEKAQQEISYNPKQSCCGQIAFNSGKWKIASKMATKFINDFDNDKVIVSPSASCSSYLKNYYTKLFKDDKAMLDRFKAFSSNIYELSDYLVNKLNFTDFNAHFPHTVTFHDSCSGLREYKLTDEARILLNQVKELQLVEMKETHECCGFGGTFAVKHKHISQAMVQQKVENAMATNADYITSTETSCLLNIEGYIQKHQLPLKTLHFSEILVQGW